MYLNDTFHLTEVIQELVQNPRQFRFVYHNLYNDTLTCIYVYWNI